MTRACHGSNECPANGLGIVRLADESEVWTHDVQNMDMNLG